MIGEKWTSFRKLIPEKNVVIVTDENILRIYGKDFGDYPVLTIKPGEKSKNLDVINDLTGRLLSLGIDRGGYIIGIGGGVVCDISGFLASVYMRGIRFGFVSTSLLSQVDASSGGKNGVNYGTVKNIIGTFNQPQFVICDQEMLKTLPEDEYLSGLAEMIKGGFIGDAGLVEAIENNIQPILDRETSLLTDLITRSVKIKASIVNNDEREKGIRKILNFGHTFGHAIEARTGLNHGFAVAAGMKIAAGISVKMGLLPTEVRDRLLKLLMLFNLLVDYHISFDDVKSYILKDKKKAGNLMNFIILEDTGKAAVNEITAERLLEYYIKHDW
jgi:3-dehydroquinate synthase